MADDSKHLRKLALHAYVYVKDIESVPSSDEVSGHAQSPALNVNECKRFLARVWDRFWEHDPYRIHDQISAALELFQNGGGNKYAAHESGCILLIGNADLLRDLESLLDPNDHYRSWGHSRSKAKVKFLQYISRFFYSCKITVKDIRRGLTANQCRGIETIIDDPGERLELVTDLIKEDPERSDALHRWGQKLENLLERMKNFLTNDISGQYLYLRELAWDVYGCGKDESVPISPVAAESEDEEVETEERSITIDLYRQDQLDLSRYNQSEYNYEYKTDLAQPPTQIAVNVNKCKSFLARLQHRFLAGNDPHGIHDSMSTILEFYQNGMLNKYAVHESACVMLIGNADLLEELEQLLEQEDDNQSWSNNRSKAMDKWLQSIAQFFDFYRITVEDIEKGLTDYHLRGIGKIIQDLEERNELVADLQKPDPQRSDAVHRWEQKLENVLKRMEEFLSENYILGLEWD